MFLPPNSPHINTMYRIPTDCSECKLVDKTMKSTNKDYINGNHIRMGNNEHRYVLDLRPFDVLLGRGTGPNCNHGNIEFRAAVEKIKTFYKTTASRKEKQRLIRSITSTVKSRDGRFLRKLNRGELKVLGLRHKVVYEVAADNIAMEKAKQALRYVNYKKHDTPVAYKNCSKDVVDDDTDKVHDDELEMQEKEGNVIVEEKQQNGSRNKKEIASDFKQSPTFNISATGHLLQKDHFRCLQYHLNESKQHHLNESKLRDPLSLTVTLSRPPAPMPPNFISTGIEPQQAFIQPPHIPTINNNEIISQHILRHFQYQVATSRILSRSQYLQRFS